jgi:hypothetical protein
LPRNSRGGGVEDLAPVDRSEQCWTLMSWERHMYQRTAEAQHATSWDNPPVHPVAGPGARLVGDSAKRQTFICDGCGATHTFLNVTLLRLVLRAIASGQRQVRLDAPGARRPVRS